jgi:uncharacterized protein YndB with AHSA1/START domain
MAQQPDYERRLLIAARPEIVFSYFTDPVKLQQWKGSQPLLAPHPGGVFQLNVADKQPMHGIYLELEEFSRIVFTWGWTDESMGVPPGGSKVEINLRAVDEGCELRIRHYGLPTPAIAGNSAGWEHYLPRLAAAAGGSDPGPDAWAERDYRADEI